MVRVKSILRIAVTSLILIVLLEIALEYCNGQLWRRFYLRNETIVVSLSTTPHRINEIGPALKSLYGQTANIKAIYLNIPYVFKRDNIEYVIPQWLLDDKRVTILRGEDYGPATKLLGTLKNANLDPNTIIITVDDDTIYSKNLVLNLAYEAAKKPDSALGANGANIEYDEDGLTSIKSKEGLLYKRINGQLVSVLHGVSGVAYRPKFFDATIYDVVNAPKECICSDDLYISFHLAKRGVPREVVFNRFVNVRNVTYLDIAGRPDALKYMYESEAIRHRACVSYMKENDPHVKF